MYNCVCVCMHICDSMVLSHFTSLPILGLQLYRPPLPYGGFPRAGLSHSTVELEKLHVDNLLAGLYFCTSTKEKTNKWPSGNAAPASCACPTSPSTPNNIDTPTS